MFCTLNMIFSVFCGFTIFVTFIYTFHSYTALVFYYMCEFLRILVLTPGINSFNFGLQWNRMVQFPRNTIKRSSTAIFCIHSNRRQ